MRRAGSPRRRSVRSPAPTGSRTRSSRLWWMASFGLVLAGVRQPAADAHPAAERLAQAGAEKPRSPQEEKRRKLLEEMGLHEQPPAPVPTAPSSGEAPTAAPPAGTTPTPPPGAGGGRAGGSSSTRGSVLPAAPSFRHAIEPMLLQTCKVCHAPGGQAAMTPFVLSGDAAADHGVVVDLTDVRAPAQSLILAKASGQKPHGGGAPWAPGSAPYGEMLAWIRAGARLDGPRSGAVAGADAADVGVGLGVGVLPSSGAARVGLAPAPPARGGSLTPHRSTASSPASAATTSPPTGLVAGATAGEASASEAAAATGGGATSPATPAGTSTGPGPAAPSPPAPDFGADVHPILMHACALCHGPTGMAASTRLILSGDVDADYGKVRPLVDPGAPARSLLVTKAGGEMHAGRAVIVAGSSEAQLLVDWIAAGALRVTTPATPAEEAGAAASAPAGAPGPGGRLAASAASVGPLAAAGPSDGSPPSAASGGGMGPHGGVMLPWGLALNGRFDVDYERRNFSGDPTDSGAVNALRSYHHFLFLTRESPDDPVGLSLELLTLQFWEAHYRWNAPTLPIQVVIAAGKILVPFGADPLTHQSYGGLAGFDQRILPVIWAETGVAAHALAHARELAITDDLYVVRGYALKQADGIINLQNDFSAEDDVRLGWGNRLGAAWGPASAWYSLYYNALGFERRLVMQAVDVMLARVRAVPVLGHFSLAAGLLRADVSGGDAAGVGGPGKDYYHFGSYLQVRYHPTDWLYLQYRQGVHTFNNRRGFVVDDTRLTSADGSTHNFGVVARSGGLTAGLYYFINLEKVDEIPDDLLRASLTYDF
jgi:hypothetical protein